MSRYRDGDCDKDREMQFVAGSCGFRRPLSFAQRASRVKGYWATKKLQLSRNSHEENFCGASMRVTLRARPACNLIQDIT